MNRKYIIFVLLLFSEIVFGQDTNPFPSGALSASSLNGNNPAKNNYYLGQPNITLPLFNYKGPNYNYDLSLSYNSSGTTIDQTSSSVGLGWKLNTLPFVKRNVVGAPDDFYYTVGPYSYKTGYMITPIISTSLPRAKLDSFYYNTLDGQLDDYFYNIPGYSGKIIINKSFQVVQTVPKTNLKITLVAHLFISVRIGEFIIETPEGLVYKFDVAETLKYRTRINNVDYSYDYTGTWLPSTIKVKERSFSDSVILDAVRFNYDSYTSNEITGRQYFNAIDPYDYTQAASLQCFYSQGACCRYDYNYINSDMKIEGTLQRLKTIQLPDSSILKFNYSFNNRCDLIYEKKLDNIEVVNCNGKTVRKFGFKYSYLSGSGETTVDTCTVLDLSKRMLLKRITEIGANNDSMPSYKFDYDTTVKLPNRNIGSNDAWGHKTIFGSDTLGGSRACMLKRITYPTGSFTEYEYELNKIGWTKTSNTERIIPGVRVKRIKKCDGNSGSTAVEYSYTYTLPSGKSSGEVDYLPITNFNIYQDYKKISPCVILNDSFYHAVCNYAMNHSPINPFPVGNSCGYSIVTEQITAGLVSLGKNVYYFKNFSDYTSYTALSGQQGVLDYPFPNKQYHLPWGLGLPWKTEVYDSSSRLQKKEENTYNVTGSVLNDQAVAQFKVGLWYGPVNRSNSATNGDLYKYEMYYPIIGKSELIKKEIKEYYYNTGNILIDSISNVTTYDYVTDRSELRSISSYGSKGDTIRDINYYVTDVYTPNYVYTNLGLVLMNYYGIYSPIIKERWLSNPSGKYLLESTIQDYSPQNFSLYPDSLIKPSKSYSLKRTAPILQSNVPAFNPGVNGIFRDSSLFVLMRSISTYDYKGNVISEVDRSGTKKSYIYGYKRSYKIAECINASYNEIFFDGFEEPETWNGVTYDSTIAHTGKKSAKIIKNSAGELSYHSKQWLTVSLSVPTLYHYSAWIYSNSPNTEILLFMKRSGETGYYSYVDATSTTAVGKWTLIEKDFLVPADVTQLNIRIDNNGGGTVWFDDIRLHPSAASMSTYTYDPLIGKTSESDIANKVTYYEYDNFGRPKVVRDNDRNILKTWCYNYAGQSENCNLVGNIQKTGNFTKNNCGSSYQGNGVTYTVPANKYFALTQSEADAQAEADVNAYGQVYANLHDTCTPIVYYNYERTVHWIKDDCTGDSSGTMVPYTIPANTYSSTVSQAYADSLANDACYVGGQANANLYGSCVSNNITLNYTTNSYLYYPIYFTFTNLSTSEVYYLETTPYSSPYSPHALGQLPPGYYDIEIYNPYGGGYRYYDIGCYDYAYGYYYAYGYSIYLDEYCNTIDIN